MWGVIIFFVFQFYNRERSNIIYPLGTSGQNIIDPFYTFNSILTKFHHLFCFSILEPRRVKYHISFRDIRAKYNRSILQIQFYSDKISSSFSFRDIRTKYNSSILYLQHIKFGISFGLTIQ